jgi:hypothetical protein
MEELGGCEGCGGVVSGGEWRVATGWLSDPYTYVIEKYA